MRLETLKYGFDLGRTLIQWDVSIQESDAIFCKPNATCYYQRLGVGYFFSGFDCQVLKESIVYACHPSLILATFSISFQSLLEYA
jgi:hypothetical protein